MPKRKSPPKNDQENVLSRKNLIIASIVGITVILTFIIELPRTIRETIDVFRTTETSALTNTPDPSTIPTATRTPQLVDRSSISWDFSAGYIGDYEIPPNQSQPIQIIAFGYSWPKFPKLTYAVSGDFEVVVRTKIDSPQNIGFATRLAGLGVVSSQTDYIVLLGKGIVPQPTGEHVRAVGGTLEKIDDNYLGNTTECNQKEITLKIVKQGTFVSFLCEHDSQGWIVIRERFQIDLGNIAKVFLFAYSTDGEQIIAEFYDFAVLQY